MGSPMFLNRQKAIALQEAIQTTERLLESLPGEEGSNERLGSAQHDVVGRQMPDFVVSMLIAELTRVVAAQQERIEESEKVLAEKGSSSKKK